VTSSLSSNNTFFVSLIESRLHIPVHLRLLASNAANK